MFRKSLQEFKNIRSLCGMGLCLALSVVCGAFISLYLTASLKLSFLFLPLAVCGLFYGPVSGFIIGALSDLICCLIAPAGPYFPGFTLTAALTGLIFGLLLYPDRAKLWRMALAKVLINLLLNVGLNGLWLYLLYNQGFWALLPTRLMKNAILLIPEILILWFLLPPLSKAKQKIMKKQ